MQSSTATSEVVSLAATDPMDTSPTSSSMAPPAHNSSDGEHGNSSLTNGNTENNAGGHSMTGPAAMAAAQGPKVVQTAFIHKLYNMLEDNTIEHLISWSSSNESFVMSPSNEFSKVLSQYFKHTNISSFVRQLNMYGFHKVADVFHSGSPDSTLWEFKHGNGNFKKGDLVGLREIKRRASRHALIHRESFSGHKAVLNQPGTPAEPVQETPEQRMMHMERTVYHLNQRLARTDENVSMLNIKCQAMAEGLVRCHQWNHGLTTHLQSLTPAESPVHADVSNMQKEIARQLEVVRSLDNPHEMLLSGRQPFFGNMSLEANPPLSPRQMPYDDSRRSSVQMLEPPAAVPIGLGYVGRSTNISTSPRSYGVSNQNTSPNSTFNRPPLPSHRPSLASTIIHDKEPNLARRHTSADIRQHGWPPSLPPMPPIPQTLSGTTTSSTATTASPYVSGTSSSIWPSSPHRPPPTQTPSHPTGTASDQHLRDHLASYEINPPSRRPSRQITPPPPPSGLDHHPPPLPLPFPEHVGWSSTISTSINTSTPNKYPRYSAIGGPSGLPPDLHSAPATRRSSMASNVHSLLNPAETAEQEDEDEDDHGMGMGMGMGVLEERKRKRLV